MIQESDLTRIGKVVKTHGVNGEVKLSLEGGDANAYEYLICRVDGLFVPFYIEQDGHRSANGNIVKFEGIDSVADAGKLCGAYVFIDGDLVNEVEDDDLPYDFFLGFRIYEGEKLVGTISAFDCRTANVLAEIRTPDGVTCIIPFHPDFVMSVDRDDKRIEMNLPQGLVM